MQNISGAPRRGSRRTSTDGLGSVSAVPIGGSGRGASAFHLYRFRRDLLSLRFCLQVETKDLNGSERHMRRVEQGVLNGWCCGLGLPTRQATGLSCSAVSEHPSVGWWQFDSQALGMIITMCYEGMAFESVLTLISARYLLRLTRVH